LIRNLVKVSKVKALLDILQGGDAYRTDNRLGSFSRCKSADGQIYRGTSNTNRSKENLMKKRALVLLATVMLVLGASTAWAGPVVPTIPTINIYDLKKAPQRCVTATLPPPMLITMIRSLRISTAP
jgi:hypothetical protein